MLASFKCLVSEMLLLNDKPKYDDRIFAKYGWLFNRFNSVGKKLHEAARIVDLHGNSIGSLPTIIDIYDYFDMRIIKEESAHE